MTLGRPALLAPDGQPQRVEARTLALLAYLALEGPTPRSVLAGRLWPAVPEATARNNLVHLLRRIGSAHHPELFQTGTEVSLSPALKTDLGWLGDEGCTDFACGPLLDGLELDGAADLEAWLLGWRERLDVLRSGRLSAQADALEAAADYAGALRPAGLALDLNPLSEAAWRRVMRLHYLCGDRPAALLAYRRLAALLDRELDVEPLAETQTLARLIERGALPPAAVPAPTTVPLSLLRPPVLIGREAIWRQMEAAWAAGQTILLLGPAGVGKTRLMQEFLAAKGTYLPLEARPGDATVPYAATIRMLRRVLAPPDTLASLPDPVRTVLAALLPELRRDGATGPLPASTDAQVMAAVLHVYGLAMQGAVAVAFENVHDTDAASRDLGFALLSDTFPLGGRGGLPRVICTAREDELDAEHHEAFRRFAARGQVAWITVPPLSAAQCRELIASLDGVDVGSREEALFGVTGGNPLFVLETVRTVLEQGDGEGGPLPLPPRVSELLRARLGRLSPPAFQAARAAAVLRGDVTVEAVSEMLRAPLLDVVAAWEELERAQVMVGERFSHELLAETLRADLPESLRRLLSRAAARVLAGGGTEDPAPSRMAELWLAGGDAAQAAPWLLRAGAAARRTGRHREAAQFYAQAAEVYAALDAGLAFDAALEHTESLAASGDPAHPQAVEALAAQAVTPLQRAAVATQRYRAEEGQAQPPRLRQIAHEGLRALASGTASPDASPPEGLKYEAPLTEALALAAFMSGDPQGTLTHLTRLAAIGQQTGDLEWQAKAQEGLGLAYTYLDPRAAIPHLERAEPLHLRQGNRMRAGTSQAKLARLLVDLNELDAAAEAIARSQRHFAALDSRPLEWLSLLVARQMLALARGDLAGAAALSGEAEAFSPGPSALISAIRLVHAATLRRQGQPEAALRLLQATRTEPVFMNSMLPLRALREAEALADLGRVAEALARLDEAQHALTQLPNDPWRLGVLRLRASLVDGPAAAELRRQAGALADKLGMA